MSARIGKPSGGTVKCIAYSTPARQGKASLSELPSCENDVPCRLSPVPSTELFHCIKELGAQLAVLCPDTAGLGVNYQIQLIRNFAERFSEYFAEKSLDAVTDDRAADFSRYRQAKPRMPDIVLSNK
jgi:hypothetical protein